MNKYVAAIGVYALFIYLKTAFDINLGFKNGGGAIPVVVFTAGAKLFATYYLPKIMHKITLRKFLLACVAALVMPAFIASPKTAYIAPQIMAANIVPMGGGFIGGAIVGSIAGPVGGIVTATATSGWIAYRIGQARFADQLLYRAERALGRMPTQEEWKRIAAEFASEANRYSLWETVNFEGAINK